MSEIHRVKCNHCGAEAGWWTFGWAQVSVEESTSDPPRFGPAGLVFHFCPKCLTKVFGIKEAKQ
jgi:hypothetical protein